MGIGWIIFILATLGWHIGLFGMFKKAGIDGWKAFVPFYNTWCMVEKMPLKKYWFFLQQKDRWFLIIPTTVYQIENYSDIEKKNTNFKNYMLNYQKAFYPN